MKTFPTKAEMFASLKQWAWEVHLRQACLKLLEIDNYDMELRAGYIEATWRCGDERLRVRCPASEFVNGGATQ